MINRRNLSKILVGGTLSVAAGISVFDFLDNIYKQYRSNQLQLDHLRSGYAPQIGDSASDAVVNSVLRTGKLNVVVYDISFDDSREPINYKKLGDNVNTVFETLDNDIKVDLKYKYILPYNPQVFYDRDKHNSLKLNDSELSVVNSKIKRSAEQFQSLIQNKTILDSKSNYTSTIIYDSTGNLMEDPTYHYRSAILDYLIDPEDVVDLLRLDNVKVIIGDFSQSDAGGVSKSLNAGEFVLIPNEFRSENKAIYVLSHELGHKVKIQHALYPYDVMSYAPVTQYIAMHTKGVIGFSDESRGQWELIKKEFKKR